jgi:trk system potassium uptake protein TrkH
MPGSGRELIYAVRPQVVARYFGLFCLLIALMTLAPLLVAVLTGAAAMAWSYLVVIVLLLSAGLAGVRLPEPKRLQVNEALLLAALIFLVTPLIMTIPLTTAGIAWLDAFFETVSAATTTGLSTLATVEDQPAVFLFARAWMQWYGGLGIVVLSLALVMRPGLTALRLAETVPPENDLVGGTRAHARRVIKVYGIMTAAAMLGWVVLGGSAWDGLLYAFAAVSTGGFAPTDGSLADLGSGRLVWLISMCCLSGAIPLALYHTAWRKGWRQFRSDLEVRSLLLATGLVTLLLACCMVVSGGMDWRQVVYHAPVMAISAQTTAGFSSLAPSGLDAASQVVLIGTMAVGGGIGSTAGGFKLLRLLILLSLLARYVKLLSVPSSAVIDIRIGDRQLGRDEALDALLLILLFGGTVLLSWLPFLIYGIAPLPALFEVVSALGTVGLSSGVSAPDLPGPLKLVLCADMLLGRLELVAWLLIFYPRTWFGQRRRFP